MDTPSIPSACRYCNRILSIVTDTVRLHPCGCCVCKNCWMDRLAETRLISTLFVPCRACGSSVVSHHYLKYVLNGTAVVTTVVDFDYAKQQVPPPPPPPPPLPVAAVAGTAMGTMTAAAAAAAPTFKESTATITAKKTDGTTPVKKKRGRPPKHTKPLPVNTNGTTGDETTTATTAPLPANKKRGRPPKNSKPSPADGDNNNNSNSETTASTNPAPTNKRRARKSFDERLQDLLDYKQQYGHARVPYRSAGHESLGEWVKDVRRGHLKITKEQRQRLNRAGFYWETKRNMQERLWYDMLEKLKTYKEQYGDCRVRQADDKVLCEWINTQRKLKNKNELRQDRQEALDAVGMIWSTPLSTATAATATAEDGDDAVAAKTTGLSPNEHQHLGAGGGGSDGTNDNGASKNDNHHSSNNNNNNNYHDHQTHVYESHAYL